MLHYPYSKKEFPDGQIEPPALRFMPIASAPVTGHHRKEPLSKYFEPFFQVFMYINNLSISLPFSRLNSPSSSSPSLHKETPFNLFMAHLFSHCVSGTEEPRAGHSPSAVACLALSRGEGSLHSICWLSFAQCCPGHHWPPCCWQGLVVGSCSTQCQPGISGTFCQTSSQLGCRSMCWCLRLFLFLHFPFLNFRWILSAHFSSLLRTLWGINHFCLGVICKFAEHTVYPIIQIINEAIKQDWTQ